MVEGRGGGAEHPRGARLLSQPFQGPGAHAGGAGREQLATLEGRVWRGGKVTGKRECGKAQAGASAMYYT